MVKEKKLCLLSSLTKILLLVFSIVVTSIKAQENMLVLYDPLNSGSLGFRTGGQFVAEGGWQVTGDGDMIVYDLGLYIENGSL